MAVCSERLLAGISLRQVGAGDQTFLFALYASTRAEELAMARWDEQQQQAFLTMQFNAQSRCYASEYPGADLHIILIEDKPAGRLYVHHRENEIRIMDIALLPQYRRRGIGTYLLRQILAEGAHARKSVTIHVEIFNPVMQLYERLGFRRVSDTGVYYFMEWSPRENSETASQEPCKDDGRQLRECEDADKTR